MRLSSRRNSRVQCPTSQRWTVSSPWSPLRSPHKLGPTSGCPSMSNVGLLPTQAIADCPVRWYHRHTSPGDDAGRIESYVGHGTGHHLGFQHPPGGCEAVAVAVDWIWLKSTGHAVFVENTWLNRDPSPFEFAQGFLASQSALRNMG